MFIPYGMTILTHLILPVIYFIMSPTVSKSYTLSSGMSILNSSSKDIIIYISSNSSASKSVTKSDCGVIRQGSISRHSTKTFFILPSVVILFLLWYYRESKHQLPHILKMFFYESHFIFCSFECGGFYVYFIKSICEFL